MASSHFVELGAAPSVIIPKNDITSIEHPCIVKNRIKAIDMLGGAQQLALNLEQGTQHTLGLSFKPDDPASRRILSLHNETNNILLKITFPKRTGRKRKRGSNGDFVEDATHATVKRKASYVVRSLQDTHVESSVEAVGNIKSCHVWRNIPDFVYFTKNSNFLHNVEKNLLPQQYPRLKEWTLPRTYGREDTEIVPPPVFSTQSLSHNYTYRQNPAVKAVADPTTGNKVLLNRSAPLKQHIQICMYEDVNYPDGPSPDCSPLGDQTPSIQKLVEQLRVLFEQRPIWTRRAMVNSLPLDAHDQLVKYAVSYVCYSLRSGPWRDAYVKFGVDPRSDPKYRFYQTILLKMMPKDKELYRSRGLAQRVWVRNPDTESHIFTGTKVAPIDGKTWQLCDLQDPALKKLVDIQDLYLRPACETRYFGWYLNGTSAKMRILLKAKIDALAEDTELDAASIDTFMKLPERWVPKVKSDGSSEPTSGYLPDGANAQELEWASAYRSICRTSGGNLPNSGSNGKGRLSKPKPTARPSFIDIEDDSDMNNENDSEAGDDIEEDAEMAEQYAEPEDDEEDLAEGNEGEDGG